MSIRLTIFRFLCVVAVCGLIAAPMARSAIAMMAMPEAAAAIDSVGAVATDDMAEDMPCCPKKAPPGCQDCPMVSLCHAGTIVGMTGATSLIVISSAARLPMVDQTHLLGQGQGPPRRPPKA